MTNLLKELNNVLSGAGMTVDDDHYYVVATDLDNELVAPVVLFLASNAREEMLRHVKAYKALADTYQVAVVRGVHVLVFRLADAWEHLYYAEGVLV